MFLCGFCPHELFVNTKADLGNCELIHDEGLRQEYIKSSNYQCLGYEINFASRLKQIKHDLDLTIRKREAKLSQNLNEEATQAAAAPLLEKISCLQEHIDEKSKQANALGSEGLIDEAVKLMAEIEKIEEEKNNQEQLIMTLQNESEKKQRICDVCGAFLVKNDPQHRLEEHLKGKLHSGAYTIREYLKSFDSIEETLHTKYAEYNSKKSFHSSLRNGERTRFKDEPLEAGELRQSSNSPDKDYHKQMSIGRSSRKTSYNRNNTPQRDDRYNRERSYDKERSYGRHSLRRSPKSPCERYSSKHSYDRYQENNHRYRQDRNRSRSPKKSSRYSYYDDNSRSNKRNGYSDSRYKDSSSYEKRYKEKNSYEENGDGNLSWDNDQSNYNKKKNEKDSKISFGANIYDSYLSNVEKDRQENELDKQKELDKFTKHKTTPKTHDQKHTRSPVADKNLDWDTESKDNGAINMMDDWN